MKRTTSRYVCQTCGDAFLRWEGQCRSCGEWNSLVETVVHDDPRSTHRPASSGAAAVTPLGAVDLADRGADRIASGIGELDRVVGGGLVPGSIVLMGGEPGIGKSTLLLQLAAGVVAPTTDASNVLYASGEESAGQVRLRAQRLGLLTAEAKGSIGVLAEADVDAIIEAARSAPPAVLVVDSIQTMRSGDLEGPAGSVGQVRESAGRLAGFAKSAGVAVVLVGHVTKDGTLAGPKVLEHLVDAVLTLEGDRYGGLRVLRAAKNRFGPTDEIGVFEMSDRGLSEVTDPAAAFLVQHGGPVAGSVVVPTLEGSRPLMVEVQALVSPAGMGPPRRTGIGIDPNRLALLIAVLGRHAGIALGSHDVYANVAGGLTIIDRGLDLATALAVASSARDVPVALGTVAVGEVGLLGELRVVGGLERRLREAARLGFERAIVPRTDAAPRVELEVIRVSTVREAIAAASVPDGEPGARPARVAVGPGIPNPVPATAEGRAT